MLCRIFHSEGVQPARTLQLSYHTAQGSGTETGFTAAGCVHVCTPTLAFRCRWGCWNLSVCTCGCTHVWAHNCAYICSFPPAYVCVCLCLRWSSWTDLFSGLDLGAPNSVAAKVRRAAVPVNDVWWRGEQIRTAIPQHAKTSRRFRRTCAHTHAQTHRDWRVQVYLQSNGQTASKCLFTGRDTYHPLPHTIAIHGYTLLS